MGVAANYLRTLQDNPGSFTGSPGYQFALGQGQEALRRKAAVSGGGGNALAAAANYASNSALSDYGNEFSRRLQAANLEQTGELGQGQLALGQGRLALDDRLGTGNLGVAQGQLGVAQGQLALGNRRADQDFGLGMYQAGNQYSLGQQANRNTAQRNWWDYQLGQGQNANTATANANQFALGQGRNANDAYNAQTQRGTAQSNDWLAQDRARRDWMSFGPTGGLTGYEDRRPAWAR